jgi:hypothetical protein
MIKEQLIVKNKNIFLRRLSCKKLAIEQSSHLLFICLHSSIFRNNTKTIPTKKRLYH